MKNHNKTKKTQPIKWDLDVSKQVQEDMMEYERKRGPVQVPSTSNRDHAAKMREKEIALVEMLKDRAERDQILKDEYRRLANVYQDQHPGPQDTQRDTQRGPLNGQRDTPTGHRPDSAS